MVKVKGSIKQRGDSFRVRISYTQDGQRHTISKTASTLPKAEVLREKILQDIEKGTYFKATKLTVQKHLETWLDSYVKSTTSRNTQILYGYIVHKHLNPALGSIPLSKLAATQIQKFIADELSQGKSPRTVQLHFVCLHKALENAVRTNLLVRNPCALVTQPKVKRHEIKVMTESDISTFLNETRKTDYYSLFYVLLFTGLRRGELLGLRWGDVDLLGAELSINRAMVFNDNKVAFKDPKTSSSRRQIALSPSTCAILRLHKEAQNNNRESLHLSKVTDKDLVFVQGINRPLLPNTVTHKWIRITRRCGLNGVRLHDARHTHASLLLKSGVNIKTISERLGHSNISTTLNIYAHVTPGMQKDAVNRFDDLVIGDHLVTTTKQ